MFRLCLLACGAAAISTETLVDDVDATLRSALSHLRENLKVDVRPADAARLKAAPNLIKLLATARDDPHTLAEQLAASPLAAVAREVAPPTHTREGANALPIVTAHGMGDSCFNAGMKSVTEAAGKRVGAYAVCVPTADNRVGDTIDGFLKNMDRSVDAFAERVRKDPKLKGGFNAIGLSQGNNIIRGYIAKYNDPPVRTFLSICGCNAGVAAWPQCSPAGKLIGPVCRALAEVLGDLAYLKIVQDVLFQANYYRDPLRLKDDAYLSNSRLAHWNGESHANATWRANFLRTEKFVWVEGTRDTVVFPRDGEHWAAPDPADPWKDVQAMKQTAWYASDAFGLRTADAQGKHAFESFAGQHIDFTDEELFGWLDKYFT